LQASKHALSCEADRETRALVTAIDYDPIHTRRGSVRQGDAGQSRHRCDANRASPRRDAPSGQIIRLIPG
jgi:hypothetical protein